MELFYSEIQTNLAKAILTTDEKGVLYYAALGDDIATMKITMISDFELLKLPINLNPAPPNDEITKTVENYKLLLTDDITQSNKKDTKIEYEVLFGTSFQKSVWKYLKEEVDMSMTVTYSKIAYDLGIPRATRAIANACGANKIALVIPCHRAITKSGKVTGYRWGIPLKKKILKLEQEKEKKNPRNLKYL